MNPREALVLAAIVGVLAGCAGSTSASPRAERAARPAPVEPATTVPDPLPTAAPARTATTRRAGAVARPTTGASKVSAAAPATTAAPAQAPAAGPCPDSLASELTSTGSARQLITVEAAGWETSRASVQLWQRPGRCWVSAGGPWPAFIGQNGFSDHHIEGDGTTPTGMYGMGPVIYGNAPDPGVHETYHQLVCGDWWDEDPTSPGYNTFQHVACGQTPPFGGGSEALWQETAPYPSFAVIDYNTGPIVKGAGSAIFLHADTGGPTTGCVSLPLFDLDGALRWLDPSDHPVFVMGPASEITQF